MTPTVVLVPGERGVSALAGIPHVRAVVYDPDGQALPDDAAHAEVLVVQRLDPTGSGQLFAQTPRLRMVQLFSSGVERWEHVVPHGVRVSNADHAHGHTVAEWVVAQLLCHFRDLAAYRVKQAQRRWEAHRTGTLAGKRVLVFGAGDIGEHVSRMLAPFGAAVTLAGRTARAGVVDVETAMARLGDQDVVVLAVPLGDATARMVDAGRGGLVDTGAPLARKVAAYAAAGTGGSR